MSQTIKETTTNVRFVVVGTQRSGTTLIQTALDSHPQIFCEGELFQMQRLMHRIPRKSFRQPGYRWWLGQRPVRWLSHTMWRSLTVHQYLNWFMNQHQSPALGFKLMWNQTQRFPSTISFLKKNDFLLLHVRRRNILRALISRFAAHARGQHHSTGEVITPATTIPVKKILTILNKVADDNHHWERLGKQLPYLRVDYEDYVENMAKENRRMLEFLGVSADTPIQSPLVKVTPNDLHKVIANFDELANVLKGTKYEAMLET